MLKQRGSSCAKSPVRVLVAVVPQGNYTAKFCVQTRFRYRIGTPGFASRRL